MADSTLDLLDRAEVFAGLTSATRLAISAVAERRVIPAGDLVFREGEPSDYVFVVARGVVEATKRSDQGADVPLRLLGVGDVGGLTSVALEQGRSATLRARVESVLVTVARQDFLVLLGSHAELGRAILAHLGAKVRAKNQRIATLEAAALPDGRIGIAFFDAKPYDRQSFDARVPAGMRLHYLEARLGPTTAALAHGFRVVCAFVGDDLGAPVLERLSLAGVELIAMRCAGYNNVDLDAAARLGLSVTRVPAYSPHAVAEHAVALILALDRKVHRAHGRVREGNFSLAGLVGFDLHGRTAGLVGLGRIGQCLARILRGFGMTVLAHDAFARPETAVELGVSLVELDELLVRSHVVSLHAPLTPATHHLVDAERIERMRPGVVLINTSRGGLIDSTALVRGLKTGHIGAAGLDVYEEESEYFFQDRSDRVITDDLLARLMTFNNVIITSHQGFLTEEALANIAETTLGNIAEYLAGKRRSDLTNAVVPGG
ncbi:MAG: cyclic nucleotide-binding domain-containing protein [Polyangiaceae bacterium]|nr:cyclic nucleotide-binding domain-containing protein [Polyangiaceae bacterium]